MPTNEGFGATHNRAFKGVDYNPDLFRIKASPSDIEGIGYGDYDAQAALVNQFDYGDANADMDTNPISIWIGSEGAYNAGYLTGLWVDLPATEEDLDDVVDMMTFGGSGDYGVMDYSVADGMFGDMVRDLGTDVYAINELAERILEVGEDKMHIIAIVMNEWGITNDFEEAAKIADEVYVYENRRDAASEIMPMANPDALQFHFDMDYFRQEIGYDWDEEDPDMIESYGDFDTYVDSMYDLMSSENSSSFWTTYVDEDSFMNDFEIEWTTHEDSTGYYAYSG